MTRPDLRIASDRPRDPRPEIKLGHDLARVADEAVQAIAKSPNLYQRGGALVSVQSPAVAPSSTIDERRARLADTLPTIREMPSSIVKERLSHVARWMRFDSRAGEWRQTQVPDDVVKIVHNRGEWRGVRPLVAITLAPTLRPDGTVLQTHGYDPATGLVYWSTGVDFPEVRDDATKDDAELAAKLLLDVVRDFPFATDSDRSAWLAGLLTVVGRHAINGPVPLFAVDGTTRGTGKSLLVDVAVRIATGQDAPRTSLSGQDEEQRKQITSLLSLGDPVVLLDNVRTGAKLGGPALDAVLTSATWKERVLGSTRVATVPARAVWWATGNNVQFGGDLTRRALRIRLASPHDNPEERTDFAQADLRAHVTAKRASLVVHALTILRAHANAGRPMIGSTWGSFEAWSRVIASALRWVGLADPLASRATADEALDDDRSAAHAVLASLEAIGATAPGKAITTRELVVHLYPGGEAEGLYSRPDKSPTFPGARDALESSSRSRGAPSPKDVGHFMRKHAGRVVAGRRLVSTFDSHAKVQRWFAESLAPVESTPPPASDELSDDDDFGGLPA